MAADTDKNAKKILVVEDERALSDAIKLKLTSMGYAVEAAYDGMEALEKLAHNQYDLVLLDIIMPRMDGFGFLEKRKEQGHPGKVMVLSNLEQQDSMEKAKELGATEYYMKSNTPIGKIIERVEAVLGAE